MSSSLMSKNANQRKSGGLTVNDLGSLSRDNRRGLSRRLLDRSLRVILALLLAGQPLLAGPVTATTPPATGKKQEPAGHPVALRANNTAAAASGALRHAQADQAPVGSPPLLSAADGVTALSGRLLATENGLPLQGVILRLGVVQTTSDQDGRFLLENAIPGDEVLVIDGRRAQSESGVGASDRGVYEVRVHTDAGRTTRLDWVSWLPLIDHEHDVSLAAPTAQDVVARTPAVPGLELRIPKGAVLTGIDGEVVKRVGLTAVPVNRPPFPLPRNVEVPIYFTAQPGGAVISSTDGEWLGAQIVYPNYYNELPKARGVFWRYEPDGQLGWSPYGLGTVNADGSQMVPDPGTRIYALSGAMFNGAGAAPPPNGPPPGPVPAGSPPGPPPYLPDGPGPGQQPTPPNFPPSPSPDNNPPRNDGDPIDLATGLYVQRQTDLYVDGLMPIGVTRTYRPGDYNRRAFGVGMSLTYSMGLHSTNQYQVVDLIMPDGGLVHYTRIINPANPTDNDWTTAHFVTSTPGIFYQSRIDWNGNGWNLIRKDGVMLVFGENLPLQYMQDRFGNKVTLTYSNGSSGNITQVLSSTGRFIRFSYDSAGRIVQAVDNIGRTVGYTYDSGGRLATVTDPNGGVTTYTWDSANRVQSFQDARGITFLTNTYDCSDRVITQTLADGSTYNFSYTPVTTTTTTTGTGAPAAGGSSSGSSGGAGIPACVPPSGPPGLVAGTDVTDPRGYVHKQTFNAAGYAVTDKYATGTPQEADWSFTRDSVSNLVLSAVDPLGRSTTYTYDANGNVLTVTRLAGTSNAVTYTYTYETVFNTPTSITDPLGHTVTVQRDGLGLITSMSDPLGNTTTFTHNAKGQLLTATDALNHTTQFAYGPDSDLTSVTDPLGRAARSYTDAIGRRLIVIDASGEIVRTEQDAINGPNKVTDGNGAITTVTYTPTGKFASITDPRNGQIAFTYDSLGRLATWIDANGAVESVNQRSSTGYVLSSTDRNGKVTTFSYDALNRPSTITYGDNSVLNLTWDAGNRLTNVQDSVGGAISRNYDNLDRLVSETTPQGTVTYTYDAAGRRSTMQAGSQPQVSYTYDDANRLTAITQASSSVSFGYDVANQRTSATLPGNISVSYTFDAASQLTNISYANGSTNLGTLTYGYDLTGRVVSRGGTLFQSILPTPVTSASYDLANRLISRTAGGVTANPTWDKNGNMTSDGVSTFQWDARDRLTLVSGVASFVYDAANRRQIAARNGTTTSFLYDNSEIVQEQQGAGANSDLLSGLGVDERYARGGSTVLTGALGSTVALASVGAINTLYGYDPYGTSRVTGTASDNTFQFTGRENDGADLYNYRNRYYKPSWGRFISEDQLGIKGGDVNLYRYVSNDPINQRDPSGNCGPACAILVGAGIGGVVGAVTGAFATWAGGDPCAPVDWKGIGYGALQGAMSGAIIGGASAFGPFGGSLRSSAWWTSGAGVTAVWVGQMIGSYRGGPPGLGSGGGSCNYPSH